MELKDQVCSLELAQKLKELGVKQESLFYWWVFKNRKKVVIEHQLHDPQCSYQRYDYRTPTTSCSAFTVAELGEMLPLDVHDEIRGIINLYIFKRTENEWAIYYQNRDEVVLAQIAETEADARAKMLIYLTENKLLTLK